VKIAVVILALIHGVIHLLGFVKAFHLQEIKALTLPISKTMGTLWLAASLLFIIYALSLSLGHKYSWILGVTAVVLSQFVIILFWSDAKWGTVPNLILLLAVLISWGGFQFEQKIKRETQQILSQVSLTETNIVSEEDIANLPHPVKQWMSTNGILGREEIKPVQLKQKARMKMNPEQKDWKTATATQLITTESPAFIWTVDMKMSPFLHITGRDKYAEGSGEMLIKLFSLFTVAHEKGPKIDEGTLQRFLGEMVWCPSLALSPFIEWQEIDEFSSKATMKYGGVSGSGVFHFNENGDFTKYVALRYRGNAEDAKRIPWILTVDEYRQFNNIKVPSEMKATWELEDESWTWLELEILDLKTNRQVSISK